jgi:hypothetical protein
MREGRPQLVPERAPQAGDARPLTTLHVIAFNEDDGEMAKFDLPFWLLRMKSGPIRIGAYAQGWDNRGVSFNVKDIEDHGPGIVVDVSGAEMRRGRDGRLLIWVE